MPNTTPRLSAKMREGIAQSRPLTAMLVRVVQHRDGTPQFYACALGAAALGLGIVVVAAGYDGRPGVQALNDAEILAACGLTADPKIAYSVLSPQVRRALKWDTVDGKTRKTISLVKLIVYLNDVATWRRDRIAALVERLGY